MTSTGGKKDKFCFSVLVLEVTCYPDTSVSLKVKMNFPGFVVLVGFFVLVFFFFFHSLASEYSVYNEYLHSFSNISGFLLLLKAIAPL